MIENRVENPRYRFVYKSKYNFIENISKMRLISQYKQNRFPVRYRIFFMLDKNKSLLNGAALLCSSLHIPLALICISALSHKGSLISKPLIIGGH